MQIGQKGLDLIKSFEGCRLTAYRCPAGVWTIGYGHTAGVKPGQVITQAQAEELLIQDMRKYEQRVTKYDHTYNWNQNEFDAMVSFAFNVGSIDQLTAKGTRSRAVIAGKLLEYIKGGGKVLPGLQRRRQAERALFLTPVEEKPTVKNGWHYEGKDWYLYQNGKKVVGDWYLHKGAWYFLNRDTGKMVHGDWVEWKSQWYFLSSSGAMHTGWLEWKGEWYYLDGSRGGAMATNTTIEGYRVDASGKWV